MPTSLPTRFLSIILPPDHPLLAGKDEDVLYFEALAAASTFPWFDEFLQQGRRQSWQGRVVLFAARPGKTPGLVLQEENGPYTLEQMELATTRQGRGLLCKCFLGRYYSLTVRREDDGKEEAPFAPAVIDAGKVLPLFRGEAQGAVDFQVRPPGEDDRRKNLISLEYVCRKLFSKILDDHVASGSIPQGLILFAGATKSNKSVLARGLVHQLLAHGNVQALKRQHIVTVEDPIEARLHPDSPLIRVGKQRFQYTPRSIPQDVGSVSDALLDALRQTPLVLYAGEIRTPQQWRDVMEFAETGHLVVATAHAGSLDRALERIFKEVGAGTPAARGGYAARILAVIHLRRFPVEGASSGLQPSVVLPAYWVGDPKSVKSIIADGLASVLPNRGYGFLVPTTVKDLIKDAQVAVCPEQVPALQEWLMNLRRACLIADLEGAQAPGPTSQMQGR